MFISICPSGGKNKTDYRICKIYMIGFHKSGFNAPPEVLLQRFLKIDLHDPRLISNAVKVIEEKVQLLEQSYHDN